MSTHTQLQSVRRRRQLRLLDRADEHTNIASWYQARYEAEMEMANAQEPMLAESRTANVLWDLHVKEAERYAALVREFNEDAADLKEEAARVL